MTTKNSNTVIMPTNNPTYANTSETLKAPTLTIIIVQKMVLSHYTTNMMQSTASKRARKYT